MNQLFSTDGVIYRFLTVTGNIIIATVLWLIGCIPVVTIGTSTAALYYTIVKSVRKEVGYVHAEFWRGYKLNLKKGAAATAALLALGLLLGMEIRMVLENGVEVSRIWYSLSGLLILLMLLVTLYLFPVMSRFDMKLGKLCMLSFVMSIRFWYITLALGAGLAGAGPGLSAAHSPDTADPGIVVLCQFFPGGEGHEGLYAQAPPGGRRRRDSGKLV